jgi:hypothetical protein
MMVIRVILNFSVVNDYWLALSEFIIKQSKLHAVCVCVCLSFC